MESPRSKEEVSAANYAITSCPFLGVPPMKVHSSAVVWSNRNKSPMRWSEDGAIDATRNLWSVWRCEYRNRLIYIGDITTYHNLNRLKGMNKLIDWNYVLIRMNRKKESDRTKAWENRAFKKYYKNNLYPVYYI